MAHGECVHAKTINSKVKQIVWPLKDVPYQTLPTCGWRAWSSSGWWKWWTGVPPWKNPRPQRQRPPLWTALCETAKHSPWLIKAGGVALLAINGPRLMTLLHSLKPRNVLARLSGSCCSGAGEWMCGFNVNIILACYNDTTCGTYFLA